MIHSPCRMVVATVLCLGGCVRLTPYDEVLETLPADEFVQVDGQWVHFERAGSGPPVVLIHGFGGSTYCWREVSPVLAKHFEVISLDLNGFGYTERPSSDYAYSLMGQVQLLTSFLDALGLQAAHLAGHSYGADIAIVTAALHPERVQTLTLVDGGVVASERSRGVPVILLPLAQWIIRNLVLDQGTIRKALEDAVFDRSIVTDEMVHEYLARLKVEGLRRAIRGFSSHDSLNASAIDYRAISQPAFVIWGENDPVFANERAIFLGARLQDASVLLLDETGHLPMEERPAALAAAILDFLHTTSSAR